MTGDLSLFSRATTLPWTRSVDCTHYTRRINNFKTLKFLTQYAANYCKSEMKIQTSSAQNAIIADCNGYLSVGNESESSQWVASLNCSTDCTPTLLCDVQCRFESGDSGSNFKTTPPLLSGLTHAISNRQVVHSPA